MKIQTKPIVIKGLNDDGARVSVEARLIVCPNCQGEWFLAYLVGDAGHLHLQCVECDESFCDGACSEGEEAKPDVGERT